MDIIQEYQRQQSWRNWHQYLNAIPLDKDDRVIDLGCSVGGVSNILAKQVASVTGIDLNGDFINYCQSNQLRNQHFMCNDFSKIDFDSLSPITGIWSSFAISYISNPDAFLNSLYRVLQPNGWIALADVACFISGNMLPDSTHYKLVREFEIESPKSGSYDFDFGSKMELLLAQTGFKIIHADNNITDTELNFDGVADSQILLNWKARLERMQGLRNKYPDEYTKICEEVIASLTSEQHRKNHNVRFVVATKL